MKKNLLIMSEMPEFLVSLFDETYNTYKVWLSDNKNEFITNIQKEIDAIAVMGGTIVSAELMKSMPKLKIVGCYGVGYDAIDVNFAQDNGIKVTNTPEVLNDEVADTAISLMLAVYKKIINAEKFARNNSWVKGEFPLTRKFSGTKLGIVGMGRIGKAIAKRAEGFGCTISYHSRNKKNVSYEYFENVNKLAEEVDTLCIITPGGKETEKLINLETFKHLGKNGVIINVARGSVIDQEAMIHCLKENLILGAGLDVYTNEPNIPKELIELNNTVLLPHIGSATVETRRAMGQLVFDNISAYFDNKEVITPVV